jgi:hypothetical protein
MASINPLRAGNTVEGRQGLTGGDNDGILGLLDLILTHVVKGDVARRVLEYLFSAIGTQERICAQDITDHGGPIGDGNVCPFMSRLRDPLSDFFDYHPVGRKSPYRVAFPSDDRGNYALHIEINLPPNDLVAGFWNSHFSGANVSLVYPERQLTDDSFSSYRGDDSASSFGGSRKPNANWDTDFVPENAVVSAGVVRSVLRLSEHFRTRQVHITANAARPWVDSLGDGNLIVLATPGSMPHLLPNLEAAGRMKTGTDAVTVMADTRQGRKAKTYRDRIENSTTVNAVEMIKWGVLTRHRYPFQRTITVLAARDEAAVEAMIQFLLNEEALLRLARELRCGENFPDHFQVLFRIHLFKGQPYAHEMTIEETVVLGSGRKT